MQFGDDANPSGVQRVVEQRDGTWDLREPPSREAVGLPPGEPDDDYSELSDTFEVHVLLPDDKRLDLRADIVGFASYGGEQPPDTGAPTGMDISRAGLSLDGVYKEMLKAVEQFGIERPAVEEWYAEARAAEGEPGPRVKSRFLDVEIGYLTLTVQARWDPGSEETGEGFGVIHYSLSWEVDQSGRPGKPSPSGAS